MIRKLARFFIPANKHESVVSFLFRQAYPATATKLAGLEKVIPQLKEERNTLKKQLKLIDEVNRIFPIKPYLKRAKLSFSQAGEDRVIFFICDYFMKKSFEQLTYLDIGANDPLNDNNTHLLYLAHGKGVLIEPNVYWCEQIKKVRPRDTVLNMGIGLSEDNKEGTYYMCDNHGLSTFSKKRCDELIKNGHRISPVENVPLITFNHVIEKYLQGNAPDFVSLDVEGLEMEILKTINWKKYRPTMFCIESNMENFKYGHAHPVIHYMESNDYFYMAHTSINMIFISRETFHKTID